MAVSLPTRIFVTGEIHTAGHHNSNINGAFAILAAILNGTNNTAVTLAGLLTLNAGLTVSAGNVAFPSKSIARAALADRYFKGVASHVAPAASGSVVLALNSFFGGASEAGRRVYTADVSNVLTDEVGLAIRTNAAGGAGDLHRLMVLDFNNADAKVHSLLPTDPYTEQTLESWNTGIPAQTLRDIWYSGYNHLFGMRFGSSISNARIHMWTRVGTGFGGSFDGASWAFANSIQAAEISNGPNDAITGYIPTGQSNTNPLNWRLFGFDGNSGRRVVEWRISAVTSSSFSVTQVQTFTLPTGRTYFNAIAASPTRLYFPVRSSGGSHIDGIYVTDHAGTEQTTEFIGITSELIDNDNVTSCELVNNTTLYILQGDSVVTGIQVVDSDSLWFEEDGTTARNPRAGDGFVSDGTKWVLDPNGVAV